MPLISPGDAVASSQVVDTEHRITNGALRSEPQKRAPGDVGPAQPEYWSAVLKQNEKNRDPSEMKTRLPGGRMPFIFNGF
ncbi:MAG: hypothetical protein Q4D19_03510 [Lautropia sp.]|nr:hypothetical protein [Lautropia sp.]